MYEWLLVFGVVLWLAVGFWYARQPIASVYHPITYYLIFHGILFAIRPVLAWAYGYNGLYALYQFTPGMTDKSTVLAAVDLALVVFVGVAAWAGNLPFSRSPPRARGKPPQLDTAFWLTLLCCGPLAVASLGSSLASSTAQVSDMVTVNGTAVNTAGNGYYSDAALMRGALVALFAWAGRFRWWTLGPAILFVFAKAGTGGRWPFVMSVMSLALFYMYDLRLRWPPVRVASLAVPLMMLFTAIGADRGAAIRKLFDANTQGAVDADYFAGRPLESMDYGNMEFFEYLVHFVPGRSGTYDYFLFNLQIFTEPVPRILWHNKPIGAPIQLFSLWDYGSPIGMTLSLPGVGWFEAGWIGVVIWTALFGLGYGRLYNGFVRSDQSRIKTALYLIVLPVSLQAFRDGSLLSILKTSFFPLAPVLLWKLIGSLLAGSSRANNLRGRPV